MVYRTCQTLIFINNFKAMKSFSNDLSPIHLKNKRKDYLAQEIRHKFEGEPSNATQYNDTIIFTNQLQEQRISTAAKTLTYLFSSDIDLLENIEQNIENYDKYQKAKLILREILNASIGNGLQDEIMRTSEEIIKLQWQIQELSIAFQQLEEENKQKDEEIAKYRKCIIDLSKAYEEAKICFNDEILEQKYEIDELKRMIERYERKDRPKSKSKNKKVTLDIPDHKKRKESEAYTDRSIYKRFTASQLHEEQHVEKSFHEEPSESSQGNHISYTHHHLIIERYQFEKEGMQKKITQFEQKVIRLEQLNNQLNEKTERQLYQLRSKVSFLESEVQVKLLKLKQKNKIIAELLDSIQGKVKQNR